MLQFLIWVFFVFVYIILKIPSWFYTVIVKANNSRGYWYKSALGLDRYINHDCYGLLNVSFLKKDALYLFGNFNDTVSFVLGINQLDKKLSILGWLLVLILWIFVPLKKDGKWTTYYLRIGHCQWAVESTNF